MIELLISLYGIAAYLVVLATFAYTIAFVGDLPVPHTVDTGPQGSPIHAAVVDLLLLASFALQHSVMARPAFKRAWTRVVAAPVERSTYVVASSLALAALLVFWRPIAQPVIWLVEDSRAVFAIEALFWSGWLLVLASTFFINHFEMFGLQQVAARALRRGVAVHEFRTPWLYRHVRHPLYLGFLVAFWATPRMTAGHLLLALGMTGYILVGIRFEERDLVAAFGERYREYQRKVGMLLPRRLG